MESLLEKNGNKDDGLEENGGEIDKFSDSVEEEEGRVSSWSSEASTPEDAPSVSVSDSAVSLKQDGPLGRLLRRASVSDSVGRQEKSLKETEMMRERFSKLLLGEDMSGCGKGVCTALAVSNAITNLCATIFGQLWRLEPIPSENKAMWRREMEWLLSVSDHILDLIPSWQTFPDGSKLEVMTCRQRSDLFVNLPALQKLDNMLLEILDGFSNPEFWYVDQGILASDTDGSASFRKVAVPHHEEKWWLPVPRVPPGGISENTRKELQHKRECTNQILKAAMSINSNALAEMEIPDSYIDSLPKNGRASLGDVMHRYITSEHVQFSPDCLLACLEISNEHQALEIANRVEAALYLWRRKTPRTTIKPSWGMVKDMMVDMEKRELLADRAESLLLCLKQSFPGLRQTALDMSKIQYNKDVGKSILESYSRVLESLAFNIIARFDELLYADDMAKYSSIPPVNIVEHKKVPQTFATPSFSPALSDSPTSDQRWLFINKKNLTLGFGVKKVLTDYLGIEAKVKKGSNLLEVSELMTNR